MSISDTQYAAWLDDPAAIPVVLFEVDVNSGGSEITRYLSNKVYYGNTPQPYDACVVGGIKVTSSITMDLQIQLAAGDIEISNADGSRDAWLNDVWSNRGLRVFVGDTKWDRTDFRQIFKGYSAKLTGTKQRNSLNLMIRDMLQALNTPVTDVKLGGSTLNADKLVPVALGECPNVTPLLSNGTTEFVFGQGASERVIETRTDAKPRTVTVDLANSKITFTSAVGPGAVTCSIQGDKFGGTYYNTISKLVQRLATGYGNVSRRLTTADLDLTNLNAFDSANPQPVGLYLTESINVLDAMQQLASSKGAQVVPSRLGQLRIVQFNIPTSATFDITRSDQVDKTIRIVNETEVAAAVKIGYCRNYTQQPDLVTSIPQAHKDMLAKDYMTVTAVDSAVKALYKLDADPVQENTCLLNTTDATDEANRRLNLKKQTRTTYRFDSGRKQLLVDLGQAVTLFSNRFGLQNGKVGLVTSVSQDWGTLRVTLEVTI
jgi:hypothetical protein